MTSRGPSQYVIALCLVSHSKDIGMFTLNGFEQKFGNSNGQHDDKP